MLTAEERVRIYKDGYNHCVFEQDRIDAVQHAVDILKSLPTSKENTYLTGQLNATIHYLEHN